ncbi:MAG TPA: LiaF domain-containing protein [Acidimicrobiia bacterium]|jgi:predicted membrane protein
MTDPETTRVEPTVAHDSRHPSYGTVVTGVILVLLGVLWALDAADVAEIRLSMVIPITLAVVGLALMIGSFRGEHPGLITLGVFLTVATLLVSFLPGSFRGGVGDREIRVTQMSELEDRYDLALGKIQLDLEDLDLTQSAEVELSVGAGEIQVRVPDDVEFRVEASVGAGEIQVVDESSEGITPRLDYTSPGFDSASTTLTLKINVGAGKIEVR